MHPWLHAIYTWLDSTFFFINWIRIWFQVYSRLFHFLYLQFLTIPFIVRLRSFYFHLIHDPIPLPPIPIPFIKRWRPHRPVLAMPNDLLRMIFLDLVGGEERIRPIDFEFIPRSYETDVVVKWSRYDGLLLLGKVCKEWRRVSQALLWEHVYCRHQSQVDNVLKYIERFGTPIDQGFRVTRVTINLDASDHRRWLEKGEKEVEFEWWPTILWPWGIAYWVYKTFLEEDLRGKSRVDAWGRVPMSLLYRLDTLTHLDITKTLLIEDPLCHQLPLRPRNPQRCLSPTSCGHPHPHEYEYQHSTHLLPHLRHLTLSFGFPMRLPPRPELRCYALLLSAPNLDSLKIMTFCTPDDLFPDIHDFQHYIQDAFDILSPRLRHLHLQVDEQCYPLFRDLIGNATGLTSVVLEAATVNANILSDLPSPGTIKHLTLYHLITTPFPVARIFTAVVEEFGVMDKVEVVKVYRKENKIPWGHRRAPPRSAELVDEDGFWKVVEGELKKRGKELILLEEPEPTYREY